jgi:CRISPR-associated endoribonuclease Cas6
MRIFNLKVIFTDILKNDLKKSTCYMRFKITLQLIDTRLTILPINYQYELSAWIYHTIHFANPEFSEWLHQKGYSTGTQRFKFFTFSNLEFPHGGYKVAGDRLRILLETCSLQISFLIDDAAMPFITGIFQNQDFVLGDTQSRVPFKVQRIERLPDPDFSNEMTFTTLSPVVVGKSRMAEGGKGTEYLSPEDNEYERLFFQNLSRKVGVSNTGFKITPDQIAECRFQLIGKPKSKMIAIKNNKQEATKVKGYLFRFKVIAPPEWIRVGYFAGFGEKNGVGMGCVNSNN